MELVVAGIDPAHASVDVRASLDRARREDLLAAMAALPDAEEAAVADQGERYEAYAVFREGFDSFGVLGNLFASHLGVSPSHIAGCFYAAEGIDAAMHAMHVACGSDSFARGRDVPAPRFMRESARGSGMPAEAIEQLFREAGEAACALGLRRDEDARSRAAADMAVELARFVFDDLGKCSIMMEVSNPQASFFRTAFSAAGASVFDIREKDDLVESMAKADVSLLWGARAFDAAAAKRLRRARRGRLSVVFDLAGESCACARADVDDVFVYGRRDLQDAAAACEREGAGDAERARAIRERARSYMRWFDNRDVSASG